MKYHPIVFLVLLTAGVSAFAIPDAVACYRLLGERGVEGGVQTYTAKVSRLSPEWLDHHVVGTAEKAMAVYPAAAYLDGIFTAMMAQPGKGDSGAIALSHVEILKPLPLMAGKPGAPAKEASIVTTLREPTHGGMPFSIASRGEHMKGTAAFANAVTEPANWYDPSRLTVLFPVKELYKTLADRGLPYGESFRLLDLDIRIQGEVGRASIVPHASHDFTQYVLHPTVIDNALHVVAAILISSHAQWKVPDWVANGVALPVGFDRVQVSALSPTQEKGPFLCDAKITGVTVGEVPTDGSKQIATATYDLILRDGKGRAVFSITGGRLQFRNH